jgi:GntR family transcriptional regulator
MKHLDPESAIPLYHQLFRRLREGIIRGGFKAGALLPSQADLEKTYGVSRITVRRAVEELRQRGLVEPENGRGVRVLHSRLGGAPIFGGLEGMLENNLAMGLETEVELLEFDYVPAFNEIAEALGIPPGAMVQHAVRIRKMNGMPFSHLTTSVPEHLGLQYHSDDMATQPLLLLLERTGVKVESARQTITAEMASRQIARLLHVEVGTALLRIERIVLAEDNQPVEHIIGLYRPDIYAYRMTLTREGGVPANRWTHAVSE